MNRYPDLPPGCTPMMIEDAMGDCECFGSPSRDNPDCSLCHPEARKDCQDNFNEYTDGPGVYWSDTMGWVTIPEGN
jgi:hypothetical protein